MQRASLLQPFLRQSRASRPRILPFRPRPVPATSLTGQPVRRHATHPHEQPSSEDGTREAVFHGNKSQKRRHNEFLDALWSEDTDPKTAHAAKERRISRGKTYKPSQSPKSQDRRHRRSSSSGTSRSQGHLRGRSRRAPSPPPGRLSRPSTRAKLLNEAHIRQTRLLPTQEDYPNAPRDLFATPKTILSNASDLGTETTSATVDRGSGVFQCTVKCQMPEREPIEGIGEDYTKRGAERAAFLQVVADLHQRGLLREIYGADPKIDKGMLSDEADAKTDIYNYAARFDCVPQFNIRMVERQLRTRGKSLVEVTVALPEQNIKVTARAQTLKAAEIAASVRFKAEAEKYHAEHGEDVIVIRDSTALNTGNARKFLDYYKMMNKGVFIDATFDQGDTAYRGQKPFRCQVFLDMEPIGEPTEMIAKKKAEELAHLTAAVALKKAEPSLWPTFIRALQAGNGDFLRPVPPVDMFFDTETAVTMRETLHKVRKAGLPDIHEDLVLDEGKEVGKRVRAYAQLSPAQVSARNISLRKRHDAFCNDPNLVEQRRKKEDLPMNQYRAKVIDLVENNTYSIIVGATGSGKTTQVPQILLDKAILEDSGAGCNIICTQPRRIAATSVARRVADERKERLQRSVGYQVRFDAKLPEFGGSITYATTGILLQQLQHAPDEVLDRTSHLIIDEVHERDILIDFLLIILKKAVSERVKAGKLTPRVVLMSATMDTELFAGYFKNADHDGSPTECPSLSVPGRTFPVKEFYLQDVADELDRAYPRRLQLLVSDQATREYMQLERSFDPGKSTSFDEMTGDGEAVIDWKRERIISAEDGPAFSNEREDALVPIGLVALTIAHITKSSEDGAILVFLPGLAELLSVEKLLRQQKPLNIDFNDESRFKVSLLHSSLPANQDDVFNPVADGCRKIILSTNVAETSVTIPDVKHVVDTGKLREKRYDQIRRITKLQCTWISKSNSKQRAGRAGRVQNGNYYALFSKARYDSLRAIGLPEMLRSDLQEICLDIKAQAFTTPIRQFLSQAIEPPLPKAVDSSVTGLQALAALTDEEALTPLGRLLASLPVHPALGKMIVLGVIFRCLDPMLILGASSGERSLFMTPIEGRKQAQKLQHSYAGDTHSDHIAVLDAFRTMRLVRDRNGHREMMNLAYKHFIHVGAFQTVEQTACQIEEMLVEAGLIPYTAPHQRQNSELGHPSLNENSSEVPLIKALALAGMHPNLAVSLTGRVNRTPGESTAMVHPSSINYPGRGRGSSGEDDMAMPRGTLLTYSTMNRSADGKSIFLRETSRTSPLMAALFGGRLRSSPNSRNVLVMDDWLPLYVRDTDDGRALKTVVELRKALDRMLAGAFRDLSRRGDSQRGYLADVEARGVFAQGLVEILDQQANAKFDDSTPGWKDSRRGQPRTFKDRFR